MRIIVCVKQVPGTNNVAIDETTGTLQRDGQDAKINPYDLYAAETAFQIADTHTSTVMALTMGPMQASAVLKEMFAMGADTGALVSDRRFAGADVLSTGYTLAGAIQCLGDFDLILCGRQTTDGDTAQVGPELAENLGIPHISNVSKILSVTDDSIRVEADYGQTYVLDAKFPCLLTVEQGIYTPRLPSYKRMIAAADRNFSVLTLDNLEDRDTQHYGLDGSPTRVARIFPPDAREGTILIDDPADLAARKLFTVLREKKFV